MKTVGVIGGSGLYEIEGFTDIRRVRLDTPWGSPSDELVEGRLGHTKMIFLPRHGRGHKIMPSEINYRANIYAMKKLGVELLISLSAVGSMREDIAPGNVVIPSQFFDYTKGRASTFFGEGLVAHVSMAEPYCPLLSDALFRACKNLGAIVHKGGVYLCIEGPQFSSRAESNIYRKWGIDVIGMTGMPEAKLAREAEICYSTLALSTDYDCWHDVHGDVSVEDVLLILAKNAELAKEVIKNVITMMPEERTCVCSNALENAIITSKDSIPRKTKDKLGLLIGRYVK